MSEFFSTSSFFVFPNGLNHGNTLFGGKMLAEIDCEAAKVARNVIFDTDATNAVTACFDRVDFKCPARQGDLVIMEADVVSFGRTSMEIVVRCYVHNGPDRSNWREICTANAIFVAMKDEKPFPHGKSMLSASSRL